jgi:uncharacterized cupin superfamily protein
MHYGLEEMFFVLSGTPTVRTPEGVERLAPGEVVYFPEGPDGLHAFSNPTDEPVRMLGISTKRFPDGSPTPSRASAWMATRHPERRVPEAATKESSPASICLAASDSHPSGDIREYWRTSLLSP